MACQEEKGGMVGFMSTSDSGSDDTVLASSGHGHTDQESRCATEKVVILVYSTILFMSL